MATNPHVPIGVRPEPETHRSSTHGTSHVVKPKGSSVNPSPPPPTRPLPMHGYQTLSIYPLDADINIRLNAWFGDGTINTTGGGAGWVAVPRPQNKVITAWRGPQDGFQHEIPLIFDAWQSGQSLETQMGNLEQLAGVDMFELTRPPLLIIDANGALPHDYVHSPQLNWIIPEEPVWGESIRVKGERVRQLVTVKFMAYTQVDDLSRSTPRKVSTKYVYTAKQGDTYKSIAARKLKSDGGARWANRLAQLNGHRDGSAQVGAGQQVKLPTPDELRKWKQTTRR